MLHILDLWALQSPGYKLFPLHLPPLQQLAHVYRGQVDTLHGDGLGGLLLPTL